MIAQIFNQKANLNSIEDFFNMNLINSKAKEVKLRKAMIQIAKLTYSKGMIAASDGNMSAKIAENRYLVTPSGLFKGFLEESDLVVIDQNGDVIEGNHGPSSELMMHLKAYEMRSDIEAVVHAHPPVITAFSVAGIDLTEAILPETIFILGEIKFAQYSTPTTEDVPKAIENLISQHDALVLTRHGSLTVGKTLEEAYQKLESLEHTAKIISEAVKLRGGKMVSPLPSNEIDKLWEINEKLTGKKRPGKINDISNEGPISHELIAKTVMDVLKEMNFQ